MKIIVQGDGSKTIATFLYSLLSSWGIPVEFPIETTGMNFDKVKSRVRKIADSLEEPIEISVSSKETEISRWTNNLTMDENGEIIVKGTWVTVTHVVSLIIDGFSWEYILRTHPELCEDDIRACLSYSIQEEGEEPKSDWSKGYTRITGRPFPVH